MTASQRPKNTSSGRATDGKFLSGSRHPKALDLRELEVRTVKLLAPGTLRVVPGTCRREPKTRTLQLHCAACGVAKRVNLDNYREFRNCLCQKGKYHDKRAAMLGARYDAMIQRCPLTSHVSDKNYRGRGIKVLFKSREHFIRWALKKWSEQTFKGLDFDRKDNDGHYSPRNLHLVTRSVNLLNRRPRSTT